MIQEEADLYASRLGVSRRTYLRSPSGMGCRISSDESGPRGGLQRRHR